MIDWLKIEKEYNSVVKRLGYADYKTDYYPLGDCTWSIFCSTRSMGKTTQFLLFGLFAFRDNGTVTHYVRQREDMIAPKLTRSLYSNIVELGYIREIFGDEYDDIVYKAQRFYLVKYNESGDIVKESSYITMLMSVDKWDFYKSSYNCPNGDLIIFDEFVGKSYSYNEFANFCQIISTVFRHRQTDGIANGRIIMLANTINKYSQYFSELPISQEVLLCDAGQHFIKNANGTNIYFEILGERASKQKKLFNRSIFGFAKENPNLYSITGEVGVWDSFNYPHLEHYETPIETHLTNVYIRTVDGYVRMRLESNEEIGIYINFTPTSAPAHEDSIILVSDPPRRANELYGFNEFERLVTKLKRANKLFYANNETGLKIDAFAQNVGYNLKRIC